MPYIGGTPTANFVDIPSVERFNGNNSTTSFTLSRTVGNDQILLFLWMVLFKTQINIA